MENTNKERFAYALGGFVILAGVAVVGLLIFFPLPEVNKDIVNIALGTLLGMAVTVVGYFYGSSKSSADKTEIMNKSNEEPKP